MDIAVRLLNCLLMIAMPIALGIYLVRRTGQRWKLFLVGAVLFVGSSPDIANDLEDIPPSFMAL